MADIELVIKIPEKTYIESKIECEENDRLIIDNFTLAIANGIPIPKGHGRLIDYGYVVDAIDDWVNAEEYRYTNATDYLRKRIANTPTIIEEDKGE